MYVFMIQIALTPAFDELETAGGMYKDIYGGGAVVVTQVDTVGGQQDPYAQQNQGYADQQYQQQPAG